MKTSAISTTADGCSKTPSVPAILCGTDFSEIASRAADVAAAIAKKRNLPVRLVHSAANGIIAPETPLAKWVNELAIERLEPEGQRLRASGGQVITDLRHGDPSRELISATSSVPLQMAVLGSSGTGMAERWLIGSVAERVAENAPVPTLVVRKPESLLAWLNEGKSLRVLCGVDFTVSADAAIASVKELFGLGSVELEAAYLVRSEDEFATRSSNPSNGSEPSMLDDTITLERDIWERLHDALGDMPVEVHIRRASGSPAHEFVKLADEREADLLVIGSHQRHGLRRLGHPSFSRDVLAHASTNVLCVPLASHAPKFRVPVIRRVLVATDFSAVGNNAMRYAYSLVASGGGVRIIHVCPEPPICLDPLVTSTIYLEKSLEVMRAKGDVEKRLEALIPRQLATSGVTTTSLVEVDCDTARAICEAARSFGADVICMGTHGHSRAALAVLGSVTQRVMALSHIPVLVVTPPAL